MAFRAASRLPGDCARAMGEAFSSLSSLMMVSLLSVSMPQSSPVCLCPGHPVPDGLGMPYTPLAKSHASACAIYIFMCRESPGYPTTELCRR